MKIEHLKNDITIVNADCLEYMKTLRDKSVDLVLTDPPYGTTACSWDIIIPFEPMWEQLKRITKENGAIVLFGSQPFTSALVMSNPYMFRHSWVWNKKKGGNFAQSNFQPLKIHEDILVFSKNKNRYFPQKTDAPTPSKRHLGKLGENTELRKEAGLNMKVKYSNTYEADKLMPVSILEVSKDNYKSNSVHPTQKPVALMEYLIKTYTTEGETVLDFAMGSGTTLVAAKQLGRKAIGVEISEKYCETAKSRLSQDLLF